MFYKFTRTYEMGAEHLEWGDGEKVDMDGLVGGQSRPSTPDSPDSKNSSKGEGDRRIVVRQLAAAILQVGQMISDEEKYFKHPLGEEEKDRKKRLRDEEQRRKKREIEEEDGVICDDYPLTSNGTTPFARWQASLIRCTHLGQLFLHLATLDNSVVWSKSIMNTKCRLCRRKTDPEKMLLCDSCDRGHHLYCLKPKLKTVPQGDWFCDQCRPKERVRSPKKKVRRVFSCSTEDDEDEEELALAEGSSPPVANLSPALANGHDDDENDEDYRAIKKKKSKAKKRLLDEEPPAPPQSKKKKKGGIASLLAGGRSRRAAADEGEERRRDTESEDDELDEVDDRQEDEDGLNEEEEGNRRKSSRRATAGGSSKAKKKTSSNHRDENKENARSKRRRDLDDDIELQFNVTALSDLVKGMLSHKDGWPFDRPITKADAPDYHKIIKNPIDLGTIKSKLNNLQYNCNQEVLDDIRLMFTNCAEYNMEDAEEYQCSKRLSRYFEKEIAKMGLTEEAPKSKRNR